MFIDTHSHIYTEEFNDDREEVVRRAIEADVKYIILPDIDHNTQEAMFSLVSTHPNIMFPLLGVHPTSVNSSYKEEMNIFEKFIEW